MTIHEVGNGSSCNVPERMWCAMFGGRFASLQLLQGPSELISRDVVLIGLRHLARRAEATVDVLPES